MHKLKPLEWLVVILAIILLGLVFINLIRLLAVYQDSAAWAAHELMH